MIKSKPRLIGRTRINIDNYDVDLTCIDHHKIRSLANDFIINNQISVLPVDVITIAKKNNWVIVPYSKLTEPILSLCEEIIYTDWGFTIYYNDQYMIFYNDSIKLGSQRYTIAHEIGHIMLEHFEYSDATTREIEANLFATKILMPLDILDRCKVESQMEIASLCGVSFSAASYSFKELKKKRNKNVEIKDNTDMIIQQQFAKFTKEYLKRKLQH